MTDVVHPELLPFPKRLFLDQFAAIAGDDEPKRDRFLSYYTDVIDRYSEGERDRIRAHEAGARYRATAQHVQAEKDERFWVVRGLLGLLTQADPVGAFAELLEHAFPAGQPSPLGVPWREALTGDLVLRFEANLPSPEVYAKRSKETLATSFLLPHQRSRASALGGRALEGLTKADAVLVNTSNGVAVIFEAKVLSDVSTTVSFDARRNQLARLLDVSLEAPSERGVDAALRARVPELTSVVLLTPETFLEDPTSRLYGFLHDAYRKDAATLKRHLPHRSQAECDAVAQRLGWTTWEQVNRVRPEVTPWIGSSAQALHHSPSALVTTDGPNTSA